MSSDSEKATQLLIREQLADRWQCSTKTIDRLRELDKNNPRHLKCTEITKGLIRFRLKDVQEFERRNTKNFIMTDWSNLSAEELAELDPAAGIDTTKTND